MVTKVIQEEGPEDQVSAMQVCAKLITHAFKSTQKKRSFLEEVGCDDHIHRAREQRHELPGKLDHAAVVGFEVGHFSSEPQRRRSLFDDLISGLKKTVNRRASVDNHLNQHEISSSDDSFTELY